MAEVDIDIGLITFFQYPKRQTPRTQTSKALGKVLQSYPIIQGEKHGHIILLIVQNWYLQNNSFSWNRNNLFIGLANVCLTTSLPDRHITQEKVAAFSQYNCCASCCVASGSSHIFKVAASQFTSNYRPCQPCSLRWRLRWQWQVTGFLLLEQHTWKVWRQPLSRLQMPQLLWSWSLCKCHHFWQRLWGIQYHPHIWCTALPHISGRI